MMDNNSNAITRYSDAELLEFKKLIEQKLETSKEQLNSLSERIKNTSEASGNDGDWMDDSSNMQDLDMLNAMVGRQHKHIRDLENALIRISNKRFGICVISGRLIDKRRLMAVPTTTKSLEAKTTIPEKIKREELKKKKPKTTKPTTSFSRIIKRTGGTPSSNPAKEKDIFLDDEDDFELDLDFEESKKIIDDSIESGE